MFYRFKFFLLTLLVLSFFSQAYAENQKKVIATFKFSDRMAKQDPREIREAVKDTIEISIKALNRTNDFIAFQLTKTSNKGVDFLYPNSAKRNMQTTFSAMSEKYSISNSQILASLSKFEILVPSTFSIAGFIRHLKNNSKDFYNKGFEIVNIHPDFILKPTSREPNDPDFKSQAGLKSLSPIKAWDVADGSGQTIAILDSGIKLAHEDLQDNIWENSGEIPGNNIDDDGNGFVDDVNGFNLVDYDSNVEDDGGHGTNVAGLISATRNNETGIAGACTSCKVMPVKVCNKNSCNVSDVAQGILYAVSSGAKIINISLASYNPEVEEILSEAVNIAGASGASIFASAGNDGTSNKTYPAAMSLSHPDTVFAVGSVKPGGQPWNYSNYGEYVNFMAPGNNYTTSYNGQRGGYEGVSGTSFSTAYVASAAAMIGSTGIGNAGQIMSQLAKRSNLLDDRFRGNYPNALNINLFEAVKTDDGNGDDELTISGNVTYKDIGVSAIQVIIEFKDNGEVVEKLESATDEKGYFEFSDINDLDGLNFTLTFIKPGVRVFNTPFSSQLNGRDLHFDFEADGSGNTGGAKILAGTVRSFDGEEELEGVEVRIRVLGDGNLAREETVTTDEDGKYIFEVEDDEFIILSALGDKNYTIIPPQERASKDELQAEYAFRVNGTNFGSYDINKVNAKDDIIIADFYQLNFNEREPRIEYPIGEVEFPYEEAKVISDGRVHDFYFFFYINDREHYEFYPKQVIGKQGKTLDLVFEGAAPNANYWQVMLVNKSLTAGGSNYRTNSDITFYKKAFQLAQPKAPKLIKPINNERVFSDVTFEWEAPAGQVDSYSIVLETNTGELVAKEDGITETTFKFDLLLDVGSSYKWKVLAVNATGSSPYSNYGTFIVVETPGDFDPPKILAPKGTICVGEVVASWEKTPQATTYDLKIEDYTGIELYKQDSISRTTHKVSVNLPNGTYRLGVRGVNSNGEKSNFAIQTFSIASLPSANNYLPPSFVSPEKDSTLTSTPFDINWEKASCATASKIECRGPVGNLFLAEYTTDNSHTVFRTLPDGDYRCRGLSYYGSGRNKTSEWSEYHNFKFENQDDDTNVDSCRTPEVPTIISPALGKRLYEGGNFDVRWKNVATENDNITYHIRVRDIKTYAILYTEETKTTRSNLGNIFLTKGFYAIDIEARNDCSPSSKASSFVYNHEFMVYKHGDYPEATFECDYDLDPQHLVPKLFTPKEYEGSYNPLITFQNTFADSYRVLVRKVGGSPSFYHLNETIKNTSVRVTEPMQPGFYLLGLQANYADGVSSKMCAFPFYVNYGSNGGGGDDDDDDSDDNDDPVTTCDVPSILAPSGTISQAFPFFDWSSVKNANSYDLKVYSSDFRSYLEKNEITNSNYLSNKKFEAGSYFVKVRAKCGEVLSDYSEQIFFTIFIDLDGSGNDDDNDDDGDNDDDNDDDGDDNGDNGNDDDDLADSCETPSIVAPIGTTKESPLFTWTKSNEANSYELRVYNADFRTFFTERNLTDTKYRSEKIFPAGTYYAKVKANCGTLSSLSDQVTFNVITDNSDDDDDSDDNDDSGSENIITFASYINGQLKINTKLAKRPFIRNFEFIVNAKYRPNNLVGDFGERIYRALDNEPNHQATTKFPNADFDAYAWVRTIYTNGTVGEWSKAFKFKVKNFEDDGSDDYLDDPLVVTGVTYNKFTKTLNAKTNAKLTSVFKNVEYSLNTQSGKVVFANEKGKEQLIKDNIILENGSYKMWIRIVQDNLNYQGPWSKPFLFTINDSNNGVNDPIPCNTAKVIKAEYSNSKVNIEAKPCLKASKYQFWLSKYQVGGYKTVLNKTITESDYNKNQFLEIGSYRAWVRYIDQYGRATEWSKHLDFRVTGQNSVGGGNDYGDADPDSPNLTRPNRPVINTPSTHSTAINSIGRISWSDVNARGYDLLITADSTGIFKYIKGINGTSYTVNDLLTPGETYRISVTAVSGQYRSHTSYAVIVYAYSSEDDANGGDGSFNGSEDNGDSDGSSGTVKVTSPSGVVAHAMQAVEWSAYSGSKNLSFYSLKVFKGTELFYEESDIQRTATTIRRHLLATPDEYSIEVTAHLSDGSLEVSNGSFSYYAGGNKTDFGNRPRILTPTSKSFSNNQRFTWTPVYNAAYYVFRVIEYKATYENKWNRDVYNTSYSPKEHLAIRRNKTVYIIAMDENGNEISASLPFDLY